MDSTPTKYRALLIYLAVEQKRAHRRDKIADLLWPNLQMQEARTNLRYALYNLRQVLVEPERIRSGLSPFLFITSSELQFNQASPHRLDLIDFLTFAQELDAADSISQLTQAVAYYRGEFLEDFPSVASPPFEDWVLQKRAYLEQVVDAVLETLADYHESLRNFDEAQRYTDMQIRHAPWQESAHRRLMRCLAWSGKRSEALAQFEVCRHLLEEHLQMTPSYQTSLLARAIRDETFANTAFVHVVSQVKSGKSHPSQSDGSLFVGRTAELAQLETALTATLVGQSQTTFICGSAGTGKSVLATEFARRSLSAHPELIAVYGHCTAFSGVGDPYSPFVAILHTLCGDAGSHQRAGALMQAQVQGLRSVSADTIRAIAADGTALVDRFIPASSLLRLSLTIPEVSRETLMQLEALVERTPFSSAGSELMQINLFEQYEHVLRTVAQRHPLLLILDDLQWADSGSISLLFHLVRHLVNEPILMIGVYRSDEVSLGRGGDRHPLQPVLIEAQLESGYTPIDLETSDGRSFVDALLDAEPNLYEETFRTAFFQRTTGHPLFSVELLKSLKERGDICTDDDGRWRVLRQPDWDLIPARVEAAIEQQIQNLPSRWQRILTVASVQGEVFCAEVVAAMVGSSLKEMVRQFSGDLSHRLYLVSAESVQTLGFRQISNYRFRHFLFQHYLYSTLDRSNVSYYTSRQGCSWSRSMVSRYPTMPCSWHGTLKLLIWRTKPSTI